MTLSPTQLTLRHLRREEWPLVEVVEKWNPHARIRQDLFGVIDVLAVREGRTLAIQATSAKNVASRRTKIREADATAHVLNAGWELEVWGWKKIKNKWVLHSVTQIHEDADQ